MSNTSKRRLVTPASIESAAEQIENDLERSEVIGIEAGPEAKAAIISANVEKSYAQAEEDLVKFVEKQIELMKENLLFGGQNIPSFYALNKSLMEYESVMLALIAMHQEVRVQKDIANERYENFYAEKYVEVKQSQLSLGRQAQFTAAREIEMYVRKNFMFELSQLKAEFIKAENKYNFINYLIKSWESYQFVLSNLSRNAQAEANASGVASKNPKEFGDEGE